MGEDAPEEIGDATRSPDLRSCTTSSTGSSLSWYCLEYRICQGERGR